MEFVKVAVARREKKGTAHSTRLRREGAVPAILYGLGRPNADLTITLEELERFLHTGSKLVELKLGDKTQQAILRDVQHHPITDEILHVDLLRIDEHHEIEAKVPLEYKGIAKGLAEGGVFEPVLSDVLVRCTPARLPKVIVIDVSNLKLNEAILVKDLPLPEGVKVLHHKPEDHAAHCVPQKVVVLEAPAPAAEGAAPAEPERIGGKKPEEGEAAAAEGAAGAKGAAPKKDDEKGKAGKEKK
jgi:large subunit ribosomal protein L25